MKTKTKKTKAPGKTPGPRGHRPCLYALTYIGPDQIRRTSDVVATSAADARAELARRLPFPVLILRTYREGVV